MSREHREEIKTIIQQLDRGLPLENIAPEDRKKIKDWLQTNSANFLTDEAREIRTRLLVHLSGGTEEVVSRIANQSRPVEDGKDQTLLELQVPIEGKTLAGKAHVEVRDLRIILKKRPTKGLILIESYDAKPKVEGVSPELFEWIQVERVLTKATGQSTFTSIEGGMTSSGISLEEAVGFVQGAMSLLGEEERNRLMKTFFEGESEQE